MYSINMEVGKKENGAVVKVGEIAVWYPTLEELGVAVEPTGKDEEGFVTYGDSDSPIQWLYEAAVAAVKAKARNCLVSGTVQIKEGNEIASTVEALIASAERSGAALQIRRECFADLKAFLPSLGKPAAVNAMVYDLLTNSGLAYQPADRKANLAKFLGRFMESLDADKLGKYSRVLGKIEEALNSVEDISLD